MPKKSSQRKRKLSVGGANGTLADKTALANNRDKRRRALYFEACLTVASILKRKHSSQRKRIV